jgi:hypothetical protein
LSQLAHQSNTSRVVPTRRQPLWFLTIGRR